MDLLYVMKNYKLHFNLYLVLIFIHSCRVINPPSQQIPRTDREKTTGPKYPQIEKADTVYVPYAPNRITRNIRRTADGNLLFAAFDDIILYDGTDFNHLKKPNDLKSFEAFDAREDVNGNIWVASTHQGAFKYSGNSYIHYQEQEGLIHNRAMCIFEDNAENIWIGTAMGMSLFIGKSFQNFTIENGLCDNNINTILEDKKGRLWIGTRGALCIYDPSKSDEPNNFIFKEFTNTEGEVMLNIRSIVEDHDGNMWLGGEFGLWLINETSSIKLFKNSITGLYQDHSGNLWFTHATDIPHKAGLSVLYSNSKEFGEEGVTSIFIGDGMFFGMNEDNESNIWVGNLNGVFKHDGKSIVYYRQSH